MRIERVVIEVLQACNLSCKHCYGNFEKQVIMPLSKYEHYIRQLYEQGATCLTITGGEPFLLRSKLLDYIMVARQIGYPYIAVTTNGTIQSDVLKEVIDNVNLLQISIDGPLEIHNTIRGHATFEKTISFVQMAAMIDNTKLCIMMSIHSANVEYLRHVRNIAREYNVMYAVEIVTPCGRGHNIEVINHNQMLSVKKYLDDNNLYCNDPICFCREYHEYYLNFHIIGGCSAGVSAVCIDTIGNVYPCARLRISMGNLDDGLSSIYTSPIYKQLNDRTNLQGKCSHCVYLYQCGGCRARAYAYSQNYLAEDPYCVTFKDTLSI
ncbi:MAG: radical SAM protein [Bacteroidales bacterium]|nr:radical SAM protein [Bacteroidales bacterium]